MGYLLAYEISGQACGVDLDSWSVPDLGGNPAFKFSDTVDAGYRDISSVANMQKYWTSVPNDYKKSRDCMKEYVKGLYSSHADYQGTATAPPAHVANQLWEIIATATGDFAGKEGQIAKSDGAAWTYHSKEEIGFETLSAGDKVTCCEHNIGTHSQQKAVVGIGNLIPLGQQYAVRVYEARQIRLSRATSEIFNRLFDDKDEVLNDVTNEGLLVTFYQGREGTLYGDPEGLTDYIKGEAGTKYASGGALPGLQHKGWTPDGYTMTQFTDLLIDILVNGNY